MNKKILATYALDNSISVMTEQDIKCLDIIYYAFVRVDGSDIDYSELTNINKLDRIRKINPNIKILLTAASGTNGGFGKTVLSEKTIQDCAKKLVNVVSKFNLDGLDIDWEFPSNEIEKKGHTILLRELRSHLDDIENNSHKFLCIAAGSKDWYFGITELSKSVKYLDYVNVMTYDVNANCEYTVHHACTYPMPFDKQDQGSAKENVEIFNKNGVPLEKIIIGAAFYGRQWKNVKNENNGLYSYAGSVSDYAPSYTGIKNEYLNKNGYIRYWDDVAKSPYLFNGNNFITYEDEESLSYKCNYAKQAGIAGVMIWEYNYDSDHILVSFMNEILKS